MKRFALLSVALALSIPAAGCGGDSAPSAVSKAEDPRLPAEVREYEAQNAKRLADRAEKSHAKSDKSSSKKP